MPNKPGNGAAVCPFYLSERQHVIRCEGIIEYTTVNVCFSFEDEKKYWTDRRCYSHDYKRCPYARALLALYERNEIQT